jgi:hypothetical protein
MSLDVSLKMPNTSRTGSGIFIRENGQNRELTRAEWNEKFPGREPVLSLTSPTEDDCCYDANITHNLNRMAAAAGIYEHLWTPDEIGVTRANQLIEPLRAGLALMRSDPARFKTFDASNGWGTYEQFIPWIQSYLDACERYPDAEVSASR